MDFAYIYNQIHYGFYNATIIKKQPESKKLQLIGATVGGIFQIIGYTLAKVILIGVAPALMSVPNVSIQTAVGIVLFIALYTALSGTINKFMDRKGL